MAVLSDYLQAAFVQGDHLQSTYQWKKNAQGGVCLSLVCCWYRVLIAGKCTTFDEQITALVKDFGVSLVGQSVFDDSLKGVLTATPTELAMKWNSISTVTSIEFAYDSSGNLVDPFKVALHGLADGYYLLRLTFVEGGGHGIGVLKSGNAYNVFDPNLGVYALDNATEMQDFAVLLWQKYRVDFALTVNVWQLYGMTKAQTARERMKIALSKLT